MLQPLLRVEAIQRRIKMEITLTEKELDDIIWSAHTAGEWGNYPSSAKEVIKTLNYQRSKEKKEEN